MEYLLYFGLVSFGVSIGILVVGLFSSAKIEDSWNAGYEIGFAAGFEAGSETFTELT